VTLNKGAAEAMKAAGASACTDVTGFGLFAHLYRMLRPSKLGAEIFASALPAFDGVMAALGQGVIPGAVERNREYVGNALRIAPGVEEALVNLGFDAQTSGGLLIAIPPDRLNALREALARRGAGAFVIGRIADEENQIVIQPGSATEDKTKPEIHSPESKTMKSSDPDTHPHHEGCCADLFKSDSATSSVNETQRAFGALIRSVSAGGVLSEKAKELILFSLVVHSRCQPCFNVHYRRAHELGLTEAELDEAAWCAIAMGGAPVKMFYQENMERAKKTEAKF